MMVAIILRLVGGVGTVLPAYVVFSYLALAMLLGWSLQVLTRTGWAAWLGGVVLINVLLAWQGIADHAHYLWLLGTVGFHGGAIMLGLASLAIWSDTSDTPLAPMRWWSGVVILSLGVLSDTLFLTQWALPLGVALGWRARWHWRETSLRTYAKALGCALGILAVVRIGFALTGFFKFSKVIRYVPTPFAIGQAVADFWRNLWEVLMPGAWGIGGLLAASLGILALGSWLRHRQERRLEAEVKFALVFVMTALGMVLLFPLITAYWRNEHHVRYILPVMILPPWACLAWGLREVSSVVMDRRWLMGMGAAFAILVGLAWPVISRQNLVWPYPEQHARLDRFLIEHKLTHGLSDYWNAHRLNTLSKAFVRLFPLRPDGRASFWNNNAFWLYDRNESAGELTLSPYSFIITNDLDEVALVQRFGEPDSKQEVGEYRLWLYAAEKSDALTAQLAHEVGAFLKNRPGSELIVAKP